MGETAQEYKLPVVEFWDGVIGSTIVGTLDSARTEALMESLLNELYERDSGIVILDISGVPTVDTQVSKHLVSLARAIDLMGAECIVSGVRPDVAQSVVDLGIEFEQFDTTPALSGALDKARDKMGLKIVKTGPATNGNGEGNGHVPEEVLQNANFSH